MRPLKQKPKSKFSFLTKSIKLVKNWNVLIQLYYQKVNQAFTTINLRNGLKVKLRSRTTDIQAFANVWLAEEYKQKGFEIQKDDIIIDIGAHIGLFALYVSQFCSKGKIFCFEPVSENFQLLLENIQINDLKNVNAFNLAVLESEKDVKIHLNEDKSAHSFYETNLNFENVKSISLKKILDSNDISICNLLKLDCEGSEYKILEALPDQYFNNIEKICLEYHIFDKNLTDLNKLKTRLGNLNYSIEVRLTSEKLGLLFMRKNN